MSELTRRLSDRFLRRMEDAEACAGPRIAFEIAEAHVDAGARYLNGERVSTGNVVHLADLPTATAIQNQI